MRSPWTSGGGGTAAAAAALLPALLLLLLPLPADSFIGVADSRRRPLASRPRRTRVSHRHSRRSLPSTAAPPRTIPAAVPLDVVSSGSSSEDVSVVLLVWAVRLFSAAMSYVGIVSWVDRPQGQLLVQLSLHNATDDDNPDNPQSVSRASLDVSSSVVEIRASTVPGAGLGLFAKTPLTKGTVLGTYPGVVLPLVQNLPKLRQYPSCEGYIWRFSDNRCVIDPTNATGELEGVCRGGSAALPGSHWLFQTLWHTTTTTTALCRINEPPRGFDVNVVTEENCAARSVTFALERDVLEGEELFIDYGLSYDRSMYGGGGKGS